MTTKPNRVDYRTVDYRLVKRHWRPRPMRNQGIDALHFARVGCEYHFRTSSCEGLGYSCQGCGHVACEEWVFAHPDTCSHCVGECDCHAMTTKPKTETARTPEPFKRVDDWVVDNCGNKLFRFIIPGTALSGLSLDQSKSLIDHVVSTLNACAGLSAEQVARIPGELAKLKRQRDRLLEALENLTSAAESPHPVEVEPGLVDEALAAIADCEAKE